jgi:hypothetical protein
MSSHTAKSGASRGQGEITVVLQGYWHGLTSLLVRSLNLYAVLTFLFFFGGVGMLLYAPLQQNKPLLFTIATTAGVVAALTITSILGRLFDDTSGVVTYEDSRLGGREAKVTRRIRDGGTGEIVFVPRGSVSQNIPARSIDGKAIQVGQSVVILEVSAGVALVEHLEHLEHLDLSLDANDDEHTEA